MSRKFSLIRSLLVCLVLFLAVLPPSSPAAAVSDKLPNLGMAQLSDITIVKTSTGHRLLEFSTKIVNMGTGAFEVYASRPDTSATQMSPVYQRIYNDAGGYRDVQTSDYMFYAGDGHNHWHLNQLQTYELLRLDNGVKVGTGAKTGFCFYDNYRYVTNLPGEPTSKVYTGCGDSTSLSVDTGLSIGWLDEYPYNIAYQDIDITGLTAGRYRLEVIADANHYFVESNESDNVTWVDIQILSKNGTNFKIIAWGPHI